MTDWRPFDDMNQMVELPADINTSDFEPEVKPKKKRGRPVKGPIPVKEMELWPYYTRKHPDREEGSRGPLKKPVKLDKSEFIKLALVIVGTILLTQIVQSGISYLIPH